MRQQVRERERERALGGQSRVTYQVDRGNYRIMEK
jgi:hypothetical protein